MVDMADTVGKSRMGGGGGGTSNSTIPFSTAWNGNNAPTTTTPQLGFKIAQRYGHLYEGLQAIPTADRPAFKRRYVARRYLADLARCPEGFEFQYEQEDGTYKAVILLSPPHMVAVCNDNGQWERRTRNESVDGPKPYSPEWYNQYLRENQLPGWFFMAGHIDLLTNDAEAQSLGVSPTDLLPVREIPASYLAVRYPTPPQYPELVGLSPHQDYQYTLNKDEQLRVARYFPATNVLGPNQPVVLKPGGYIVVHHDPASTGAPVLYPSSIKWTSSAASRASYVLERPDPVCITDLLAPNMAKRSGIAAAKSAEGGFVDHIGHLAGPGAWQWLEPDVDQEAAKVLGLQQPADVAVALARGHLRAGRGAYVSPSVVWLPDKRYFNPAQVPDEPGRWEFCDDESREKAREDFGGQDAFGLGDSSHPNADEMWQIREYFQKSGAAHDPTAEINLVWILADGGEQAEVEVIHENDLTQLSIPVAAIDSSSTPTPTPTASTAGPTEPDRGHGHDKTTGLAHEPYNNGENDQTASDGKGDYYTRLIKGKKITVDRARAHPIKPGVTAQLHRLWTYTLGGKWARYPESSGKIDWTDKNSVERLNRWRQQNCQRNQWESKRKVTRENYTKEQREWVFAEIVAANGHRPAKGAKGVCQEFNQKFGAERQPKAIEALLDRLVKEFKDNGGKMKDRTEKKPAAGKKRKRSVEDDGNNEGEDTTTMTNADDQTEQTDVSKIDANESIVTGGDEGIKKEAETEVEDADEDAPHELDSDFEILG